MLGKEKTALRRGFTLIELLVVIAIIALLAAILFPVFAKAREQAKTVTCLSNQKQMGLAVMLYAGDYDDNLPMDSHLGLANSWLRTLQPYIKAKLVYRCPADTSSNFERPLPNQLTTRETSYATSFYMSPFVVDPVDPMPNTGTSGFSNLSSVAAPARTIYIAEAKRNTRIDHFHPAWWYRDNPDFMFMDPDDELELSQHGTGSVYVFLDGHAKMLRFEATFSGDGKVDLFDPRRED